ncbi:phosphotransferase enzyme family protein [Dictyobacter aurantiacus]|uniref:Aminoglycoside phosphotransferase domain-containing protein n=1 Tax=Dictyobacter aurantiacus TaxID=1936993 RepID=A0A401ZS57_9CHLR|nr:phosphotransferase [Dictyobacter aurantiacus]GCE09717.1 hypothetical protein KDAU_70460 [Dictyobacter aurantiacus]
MDVSAICATWPIQGPCSLTPLTGGTNNHVWRLDAADGHAYTLRVSPGETHLPRLRYEMTILQALSIQDLPFLLPLPIHAYCGDLLVPLMLDNSKTGIATLAPFLPGIVSRKSTPAKASAAAHTLAILDQALAAVPDQSTPQEIQVLVPFGRLEERNPQIPDVGKALESLPLERQQIRKMQDILIAHQDSVEELYESLPQQLLHRDLDTSNILFDEQEHVTAVLDFEFAARDIRALDLSVSLTWWPVSRLGTGNEWEIIDSLGRSYMDVLPLEEDELRAIPAMMRMRQFASLQHRIGRYQDGLETDAAIQDNIAFALWRLDWLESQQETLIEHALNWQA